MQQQNVSCGALSRSSSASPGAGKLHSPEARLYDQDRESRPRELGPDTEAKPERVLNQPLPEECHDASQ